MAETVKRRMIEKRTRGFFGWIFLLIFWGFNAFMVYALFVGVDATTNEAARITDPTLRKAHDAGAGLGIMLLLMFWAAGSIVFGLLAFFTRGKRELLEVEIKA